MLTNTDNVSKTKYNLTLIRIIVKSCFIRFVSAYVFIVIIVSLKIYISQGSIATQLRCGGIFNNQFTTNFCTVCAGKKI